MTKNKDENELIKELSSPWEFLGYAFKYRTKEILSVIILILIGAILILNINYDKANGLQWKPAAKIEVKK
jgi:hypothetical protein